LRKASKEGTKVKLMFAAGQGKLGEGDQKQTTAFGDRKKEQLKGARGRRM